MSRGVRFTKDEREFIRKATGITRSEKEERLREGILEKLDRSEVAPRKKAEGMGVKEAVEAFRAVLGRRLIEPPNWTPQWAAMMSKRLALLGMTPDLCRAAALQAATEWAGPVKVESIVRQADKLLHNYTTGGCEPSGYQGAVYVDLNDEEL